mgnify:CR=1 FL=1
MVNIVSNEKIRLTMMKNMASMFFMPKKENEAGRAAVGESGRLRILVTSSI